MCPQSLKKRTGMDCTVVKIEIPTSEFSPAMASTGFSLRPFKSKAKWLTVFAFAEGVLSKFGN